MSALARAYSYIRFSSEGQKQGDSVRRQLALAEAYAAKHGLVLDTDSFRDLGISAFRGKNAVAGKLAMFLEAVDGELIASDSNLLVESLDRLSRHEVDDALELFLSIIRRGITIVTLADDQVYNTAAIKRDRGISLIISITIMMRAHEESATKSLRIRESWRARTERGGILTTRGPSWISWSKDRWKIDRQRAGVIRRIYRMYLRGAGSYKIARAFNAEEIPTLGTARYWSPGIVSALLKTPLVLGTMKRSAAASIENYYPPIIEREVYDRAQLIAASRHPKRDGVDEHSICLFLGISYCGVCGARFCVRGGTCFANAMMCNRAYFNAGCSAVRVPAVPAERALLETLLSRDLLDACSAAPDDARAALKIIHEKQAALRVKKERIIKRGLAGVANTHAQQLAVVEAQLQAGAAELQQLAVASSPKRGKDLLEARRLSAGLLSTHIDKIEKQELRRALKPIVRRLCTSVKFLPEERTLTIRYTAGLEVSVSYEAGPRGGEQPKRVVNRG